MRAQLICALSVAVAASGCSTPSETRTFTLQGQVQSIDAPRKLLIVKHEEIKGFMPAMTMPYEVEDASAITALAPGDLINSTLVVFSNGAHLSNIKKVGSAPLEHPPADAPMPAASSGFELLKPGEAVPSGSFVDQDGRKRSFGDFTGAPVGHGFPASAATGGRPPVCVGNAAAAGAVDPGSGCRSDDCPGRTRIRPHAPSRNLRPIEFS